MSSLTDDIAKETFDMHIHYFLTNQNLPAAILTYGEMLDFDSTLNTITSYEVEMSGGRLYPTGYMRSRGEVAGWREVSPQDVERREMHLVRCFIGTEPKFWSTYVAAMETEITTRLRLRDEWLNWQKQKKQHQEVEREQDVS